jgi:solute carrier family 25 2-oxodicarboxylate transporter 21
LLIEAPKRAIKFGANDFYSKMYLKLFSMDKPTQALAVVTGVSAGMTEAFLVISFELVKIRMQDKNLVGKYSGLWDCVRKIAAEEGILAFAKGLEPTLWRHAMWNGGYFGTIHWIRSFFVKYAPEVKNKILQDFVCGAIGGTLGTILNTPFDVVKTRIQGTVGPHPRYKWAFPALVTIGREEGVRALWKGFLPKVLRLGPGGGILLVVYTQVLAFISKHLNQSQ